jgi:hypothetical protein
MVASSVAAHVVWVPFLVIGVALLVWNRRVAHAMLAGNRASIEALEVRWLRRLLAKRERSRWYQPFARFIIVADGVIFVGISVVGLALG